MSVNCIDNNTGINLNYTTGKKRADILFAKTGVKGSCSFATVRTAEEIQKEIDDRIKAAEKNGPTLQEALANAFPNAVNTLYSFAGSSVVMTFDEYVKALEEMFRKENYPAIPF